MSSDDLSLSDYQSEALKTALYPDQGDNLVYGVMGLNGEAGELAEKYKRVLRDEDSVEDDFKEDMKKELGDVLWYVAICAHELDCDLSEIAEINLDKLLDRKDRDVIHGEGDDR